MKQSTVTEGSFVRYDPPTTHHKTIRRTTQSNSTKQSHIQPAKFSGIQSHTETTQRNTKEENADFYEFTCLVVITAVDD